METISVAVTGSSDMRCFDLYLINIFMKPRKVDRCTDFMFKLAFCLSFTVEESLKQRYKYEDINILGTRYFVLLDATSGTRLV